MHAVSESSLTESLVFTKRGHCRESLSTVFTFDLLAAIGMHPLVATEVGELGVGLQTNFTLKWLHTAVDMLVLF